MVIEVTAAKEKYSIVRENKLLGERNSGRIMLLICKRCGVKAHREREKRVRSQRGINY